LKDKNTEYRIQNLEVSLRADTAFYILYSKFWEFHIFVINPDS